MEAVKFVMHEKLLFWMEVMSVLGKAHEMFGILTKALAWPGLKVCPQIVYCNTCLMVGGQTLDLDNFIRDALRFISAFFVPISESAPHIYLSALPFSPECSLVADKFCLRFPNTLKVIEGRPVQWPMTIFTAEHHSRMDSVKCIAFSPDEKTFASISTEVGVIIMYICDSETGHRISGPFESEGAYPYEADEADACFSPDGKHVLVKYLHHAVVWDIGRGEKQFEIEGGRDFVYIHHGRYHGRIASTHRYQTDVCVQLWDAGNGVLMSNELFKVTDARIAQLSPDGRFLAIGKRSGNVIELWNVEDGMDVQRFSYPPGDLSSLCFSPTSDSLMAKSSSSDHICLWRLDTQEMASISVEIGRVPPSVICLSSTDHLFIPRSRTVGIWEVLMTESNMIVEIESPMTSRISRVCPSRDGRRLLVGSEDGSVSMWSLNAENLAEDRPLTANTQDDTDILQVISSSHSGEMVATISQSGHVEFRDTAAWEVVGRTDIECEDDMKIALSPDGNQAAFWSDSVITICDVTEKNCFSFGPWPRGRRCFIGKIAFQTCNDLVICAKLDNSDGLLQVWHLTGLECTFPLDFTFPENSRIFLAPDGLTAVIVSDDTVLCYSWDHDTAQFDPFHFTDEVHLFGYSYVYSPDGELLACRSRKDYSIRVWNTRTGRLCGEPITSRWVNAMALSPVLNDQSFGDRIVAVSCNNTIRVYNVHTGRLYAQFHAPENAIRFPPMSFIQDGTKLALHSFDEGIMRIWDLRAEYSHATHEYELILQGGEDGWMMDQDNALLFWVPSEHRQSLWVPLPRVVIGVSREKAMGLDLSSSRLVNEWTECIDKGWLKALEEKETTRKLLE